MSPQEPFPWRTLWHQTKQRILAGDAPFAVGQLVIGGTQYRSAPSILSGVPPGRVAHHFATQVLVQPPSMTRVCPVT